MLKALILKQVAHAAAELLEENKDKIKASVHEALNAQDLPIPDGLEKPIDEFMEEGVSLGLEAAIAALKALA